MQGYIDQANAKLERWETIKRFDILTTEFTVDEGEVTPSLKIRRRAVERKYADRLDCHVRQGLIVPPLQGSDDPLRTSAAAPITHGRAAGSAHSGAAITADKISDVSPHVYRCPMRWGDMDAQGHVNNASFLDYLQEARVDFLLSGPQVMHDLLESGVLVVSHQVEYLAPIRAGDQPLTINLWVDAVGGSRFAIGYDLLDGDLLAGRARTALVPFDLARDALRRLTAAEREVLLRHLAPAEPLRSLPRGALDGW